MLTAAPLGRSTPPAALSGATLVGRNESVTVEAAGFVPRYGTGDTARSAPSGERLLAFRFTTGDGDIARPPASGGIGVAVDGGRARPVPDSKDPHDYVILALPRSSKADLILDDGGFTQAISLPDGKPGSGNIAVLARRHRFAKIATAVSVPVHLSSTDGSADVSFRTTVATASLDFWPPRHPDEHPTDTSSALLTLDLDYTDPAEPDHAYGWDPGLLKLRLPGGTLVPAENIASAGNILDAFQVPAAFTSGTLQISGSQTVTGVTMTVTHVTEFTISIPAG